MENFLNVNKLKEWVRKDRQKTLIKINRRLNDFETQILKFHERLTVIERDIKDMKGGYNKK